MRSIQNKLSRLIHGFTAIEALMVIGLLSIFAVAAISVSFDVSDETAFEITVNRMIALRNAIIGNPDARQLGVRTSFGFLGDLGAIPDATAGLAALVDGSTFPAYAPDANVRFGHGWRGPYIEPGLGQVYTKDGWGTDFVYSPTASPPTITSYGSNRVAGSTAGKPFTNDLTLSLPSDFQTGKAWGLITNYNGTEFTGTADIVLNSVDGLGNPTTQTTSVVAANKGAFSFSSVAFGRRSVTIYVPNKLSPSAVVGPVAFTVDRPNTDIPIEYLKVGTPAVVLTVQPEYTNAPQWNDYVREGNLTTACDGTETIPSATTGYRVCRHGGEYRKAVVPGEYDCTGLTAVDQLGVFDWTCVIDGGYPTMKGKLKAGKSLQNLVSATSWLSNKLSVYKNGTLLVYSLSSAWWTNTVQAAPSSASAVQVLTGASTIYTISGAASGLGYNLNADKIGIVVLSGGEFTATNTTILDCTTAGENGTTAGGTITQICAGTQKFLWVEGSFRNNNSNQTRVVNPVKFVTVKFSQIRNFKTRNFLGGAAAGPDGIFLSSTTGVTIRDFSLANGYRGIYSSLSNGLTIQDGKIFNHNYGAIHLASGTDEVVSNIVIGSNSRSGGASLPSSIQVSQCVRTTITRITENLNWYATTSVGPVGVSLTAGNVLGTGKDTILHSSYLSSSGYYGLSIDAGQQYTTVTNMGIGSPGSSIVNAAGTGTSDIKFTGNLLLDKTTCAVSATGANVGITNSTCALTSPSSGTLSTGNNTDTGLYGRWEQDISTNTTDSFGSVTYNATTTQDWNNFANPFQFWGKDSLYPPIDATTAGPTGMCTTGTCRVYDARADWNSIIRGLNGGRQTLGNAASLFTAGAACPAAVNGNVTTTSVGSAGGGFAQTYLTNAVELLSDSIGDEDGVCESNESCLYAPNLGAYQGEGSLGTCTFSQSGGAVSGVTMYGYSTNGVCTRVDRGLSMPNNSNYVTVAEHGTSLSFTNTSADFTVEAWAARSATAAIGYLIAKGNASTTAVCTISGTSTANLNYALGSNATYKLYFTWRTSGSTTTRTAVDSSTWVFSPGKRHHIAVVVRPSANQVLFFSDGVLRSTVTAAFSTRALAANSSAITFGQDCVAASTVPWAGAIYSARISNNARYSGAYTPADTFTNDANTMLLTNFEETSGTSVANSATGANAGVAAAASPLWGMISRIGLTPAGNCTGGAAQ